MKIILVVFIALVMSSFVEASERRIVFEKFEDMATAQTEFKQFKKSKLYTELEAFTSGNDIKIHICSSANGVAIVANPINNKYVLSEIKSAIKNEFTKAFSEDFSGRCDVVAKIEKSNDNEVVEEDTFLDDLLNEFEDTNSSEQIDENISGINTEITPKVEKSEQEILEEARLAELKRNLEVMKEITKNSEFESWFSWWYIFWLLVFVYGYKMYKKYKPIYDEY